MREIRNLYRFIPFGKFSLSGRGKPPFNQVYVGRHKQRASFIEMLTHQESFGAFLISGQRGSGKTSFVEYCLREYQEMAYQRSIRISRNPALFSIMLLAGFCVTLVTTFVLMTQGLELGAQNVLEAILAVGVFQNRGTDGFASASVVWIAPIFLFFSFLMLWPAFFALRGAKAISVLEEDRVKRSLSIAVAVIAMIAVPVYWCVSGAFEQGELFAPVEHNSSRPNIEVLLNAYLWTLVSMYAFARINRAVFAVGGQVHAGSVGHMRFAILLSVLMGILSIFCRPNEASNMDLLHILLGNIGFLCLAKIYEYLFTKARGISTSRWINWVALLAVPVVLVFFSQWYFNSNQEPKLYDEATSWWQKFPAIQLTLIAVFLLSMFPSRRKSTLGNSRKHALAVAPFRTILIIKGSFLCLLAFVGLLPLLRVIIGWLFLVSPENVATWFNYLPDISQSHASLATCFIMIFVIMWIYACEYEWISRDLRSLRQDGTLGVLGRSKTHRDFARAWEEHDRSKNADHSEPKVVSGNIPVGGPREPFSSMSPNDRNTPLSSTLDEDNHPDFDNSKLSAKRRFVFRQIEYATLPHIVYSVRNPTMSVWVNLGFDNLEHSRIIEAMLRRLREAYRENFLSLGSPIGILNAFLLVACTVVFTSIVSKSIFATANIEDFGRENGFKYRFEGTEILAAPKFGQTNYCGFFEVYPETAPTIKSLVCALPFSNSILELLYSPILKIHVDFASDIAVFSNRFDQTKDDSDSQVTDALDQARLYKCTEKKLSEPEFVAGEIDQYLRTQSPVHYLQWSRCLPRFVGEVWAKEARTKKEIGEAADNATKMNADPLYYHFVGAPVGLSKNESESGFKLRPQYLVRDSELVHYILDRNYGLPRLDYRTQQSSRLTDGRNLHPAYSGFNAGVAGSPTLRFYHLLLYIGGFWLFFTINRRVGILPYRANQDAINELILLINGRETMKTGDREPLGWLGWLLPFRKQERVIETANDPRIVEQRLIELLGKLRPRQPSSRGSMPNVFEIRPEITFIFDEMDKHSGIVDAELTKEAAGLTQIEENNRERARSQQLHQLLSDMKRLISGNAARFIFIGGRLYHDEWLADQAQRAPILNSIFNGQIYLPSLMADRLDPYGRFNDRVTELVTLMYRNARHRLVNWRRVRNESAFQIRSSSEDPTYVQFELPFSGHPRKLAALAHLTDMRVIGADGHNYSVKAGRWRTDENTRTLSNAMSLGEQETFEQFINFLTYRSAGNPKKIKELIQGLVQTSSTALNLARHPYSQMHHVRWGKLRHEAHDLITLNDNAIYRMQFIDILYRHLADHMESRMLDRDDKVSMSIFYLMDFLMKFHNRGFSRTNLQRVDELSHIHRAPDLRSVMGALVQVSSERFLHRVLNGVYNFRFRSDFAREIDYLSRISKEEMAALNFTLDESQSLKGLYQETINTGERENIDTIAGLGELFEYDQEYEIARNYYRRAIAMLDNNQTEALQRKVVRKDIRQNRDRPWKEPKEKSVEHGNVELSLLGDILLSDDEPHSRDLLFSQMHWIVARIRLMLQVGQTYEQEMNFERAAATYTHTTRLCDQVFDLLQREIWDDGEAHDPLFWTTKISKDIDVNNFPILFQAGIAAAWVFEKDPENIDQSVTYAETWLQRVYERDPLLQRPLPDKDGYSRFQSTSAGVLIQVALSHDRVGDLYFMKGRQSLKATHLSDITDYVRAMNKFAVKKWGGKEKQRLELASRRAGYEDRAHYHYSVALWSLRKYLTHRFSIANRMWTTVEGPNVFDAIGVGPSHLHSTMADITTDLSEVIFAKRSSIATSARILLEVQETPEISFSLDDLKHYRVFKRRILNENVDRFNNAFIKSEPSNDVKKEGWGEWFGTEPNALLLNYAALVEYAWKKKPEGQERKLETLASDYRGAQPKSDLFKFLETGNTNNNTIERYIGKRSGDSMINDEAGKEKSTKHYEELMVKFDNPGDPIDQIEAYMYFSQSAARASQIIGQSTNAANEYLLQAEALGAVLWDMRTLNFVRRLNIDWPAYTEFFKNVLEGRGAQPNKPSDMRCARIALAAQSALLDAIDRIQHSERPSVTRMAQNHGKPTAEGRHDVYAKEIARLEDGISALEKEIAAEEQQKPNEDCEKLKALEEELSENKEDLAKAVQISNLAKSELRNDYDLAQAFRDDPRVITQACSIILSLLDPDVGPVSLKSAVLIYRDILCVYASDTFDVRRIDPIDPNDTKDSVRILSDALDETGAQVTNEELRRAIFEHCYCGLKTTLERFRYPVLNRLNGLKILADALATFAPKIESGAPDQKPRTECFMFLRQFASEDFQDFENFSELSELGRLVREMLVTSDIYGSEMHFSAASIGTTTAITYLLMRDRGALVLYDDLTEDEGLNDDQKAHFAHGSVGEDVVPWLRPNLNRVIFTAEAVGELAINKLNRAHESCSMGDAYYENIAYLHTLNDDFNDRSIHFTHARTMAAMDLSEILSLMVKSGFKKTDHRRTSS